MSPAQHFFSLFELQLLLHVASVLLLFNCCNEQIAWALKQIIKKMHHLRDHHLLFCQLLHRLPRIIFQSLRRPFEMHKFPISCIKASSSSAPYVFFFRVMFEIPLQKVRHQLVKLIKLQTIAHILKNFKLDSEKMVIFFVFWVARDFFCLQMLLHDVSVLLLFNGKGVAK